MGDIGSDYKITKRFLREATHETVITKQIFGFKSSVELKVSTVRKSNG